MKSHRKVLIVASFTESLPNFRGDLIQHFRAAGFQVHCAAPGLCADQDTVTKLKSWNCVCHDIPLRRLGLCPFVDMLTVFSLLRLMLSHRFQFVFSYTVKPIVYGGFTSWVMRVPVRAALVTGLGFSFAEKTRKVWAQQVAQLLYRVGVFCSTHVFFQNVDDRDLFLDMGWVKSEKVTLVAGSGVNLSYFFKSPCPAACPPRFLMIARLLAEKGVREYVEAARIVKRRFPEATFSLAGWKDVAPSAISSKELEELVAEGVVNFLGKLHDVRPALAACSVYVLPSYREGTPRTVLEAMAVGRPVIVTDAPGCRDTVIEGENGFCVPVRSSTELAEKMVWFIEHPLVLETMGEKSREIVEEKYDVCKVNKVIFDSLGIPFPKTSHKGFFYKPNICIVVSSPMTIGVFLANHLKVLSEFYRVSVVGNFGRDELDLPEEICTKQIKIKRKINLLSDLSALWRLWHYFLKNDFCVTHSVTPKAGVLTAIASLLAGVPSRFHWFTGQVWVTKRGFVRLFLKGLDVLLGRICTQILVDSLSQCQFLVEQGVVPPGKGVVLGKGSISGVDGDRFKVNIALRRKTRHELGFASEEVVILYLGRINKDKGVLDLAHAFSMLALLVENVRFLCVGPDEEDLVPTMKQICASCLERVVFMSYSDQPEEMMNASDIFCQPSYREGFGSVIIEAAACGIPAVASNIYGLVDAIVEGKTGLLFEAGNVQEIHDLLLLLCDNEGLRHKMGIAAQSRALADFSMEEISRELLKFYLREIPSENFCDG